jgi:hypothetical protein
MFHPSRIESVKDQIFLDLAVIDVLGSVKLYLCWYDEYLVPESEWNGKYPCSDRMVSLVDVIRLVKQLIVRPCIIRHNILVDPLPVAIGSIVQSPLEQYVEVCLVY